MEVDSIAVVDFMNVFYRAWKAGTPSRIHAVRSMFDTLTNVVNRLKPQYLVVAYDGGHVARSALYPEYKSGRPEKPEGMLQQQQMACQLLDSIGWPTLKIRGWEADDILATFAKKFGNKCTLISGDKDSIQCMEYGAKVYHPWKTGRMIDREYCIERYGVPPELFGNFLSLIGDEVDCIPGVLGIGPKNAAKLVAEYGDIESIIEAARVLKINGANGKNITAGVENARLSRKLIELNSDLPIGEHWLAWPVDRPRKDWRDKFQDLGLGSVANKLRLPSFQFGFTDPHCTVEVA